jgi:hypothetical protein
MMMVAGALILGLAGATSAAEPPAATNPDEKPGRFTMQPADGGFIRLDTATGDVSHCVRAGATFECKPVKDDRDMQREIAQLVEENKGLKAEIKRLEDMLGLDGSKPKPKLELPSEEDVDKALTYLERMFKKFRDKLKELDSGGNGKGTPL